MTILFGVRSRPLAPARHDDQPHDDQHDHAFHRRPPPTTSSPTNILMIRILMGIRISYHKRPTLWREGFQDFCLFWF